MDTQIQDVIVLFIRQVPISQVTERETRRLPKTAENFWKISIVEPVYQNSILKKC